MRLSLVLVFLSLVGLSALVTIAIFLKKHVSFTILAALMLAASLLGGALIFLTLKQDVGGLLKVFLILAGASPAVMVISVILHNAISGLLTALLHREVEEAVFFLTALFGCPAVFLVGIVGSITLFIRDVVLK